MDKSDKFRNKHKLKTFEQSLNGDHVLVHLNCMHESVDVPNQLRNSATVTLKLSSLFQGTMEYDNEGVTAQLKFSDGYYLCKFSWDALWAITPSEGKTKTWKEDIPPEIIMETLKTRLRDIGNKILGKGQTTDSESETQIKEAAPQSPQFKTPQSKDREEKRRSLIKRIK